MKYETPAIQSQRDLEGSLGGQIGRGSGGGQHDYQEPV